MVRIDEVAFCDSEAFAIAPGGDWRATALPWEAHGALASAGLTQHPYRNGNADALDAVAGRSWWLRIRFATDGRIPAADAVLRFDELDCVGTVWLNGVELGAHENVYRPAEFAPGDALRPGPNEVVVRLDPPLEGRTAPEASVETAQIIGALMVREDLGDGHGVFGDLRMLRVRKPVVDWGWDFAPPLPSVGLGGFAIERARSIAGVAFRTDLVDPDSSGAPTGRARVSALITAGAPEGTRVTARLTRADGGAHEAHGAIDATGVAAVQWELEHAAIWWTQDLGAQPLYELTVEVGDETAVRRVGIRTIELDRSDDGEGGRRFRFLVNGIPLFARGASAVPSDMLSRDEPRERALVELAAHAGMNMIRIWGGGGYASDALYDAADEHGVLIWQDFPFACADYPEDARMRDEIEREATHQVRRLASHASLALWCGNNEVHGMHELARRSLAPGPWGHVYFHEILPRIVGEQSPGTAYWPGSPYGEGGRAGVNGVHDGDRHAWEVWHGLSLGAPSPEYSSFGEAAHFSRYRHDTGRFISEFGIIAAPHRETLADWIDDSDLRLDSAAFRSHIRDRPKDKANAMLEIETGLPVDLDDYIARTQLLQAEGLKFGIEHYRRQEPRTAGTLVWQLNDPWPGISWSLVDHALRAKPAYFAVRRAFAPVIASFCRTDDGAVELWVSNSTDTSRELHLRVRFESLDGELLHAAQIETVAAPHDARAVWRLPAESIRLEADVVARVAESAGRLPANRLYFAPLKDVPFPEPRWDATIQPVGDEEAVVVITAESALHGVTIRSDDPSIRFDDNAVDLGAGETVAIRATGRGRLDPATLHVISTRLASAPADA